MAAKKRIVITNVRLRDSRGGVRVVASQLVEKLKDDYDVTYVGFKPVDNFNGKLIVPIKERGEDTIKTSYPIPSKRMFNIINLSIFRFLIRNMFKGFVFFQNILLVPEHLYADVVISNSPYDISVLSGKTKFKIDYKAIIFVKHDTAIKFTKFYPNSLIKNKPFKVVALNSADYSIFLKQYPKENVELIQDGLDIKESIDLNESDFEYINSLGINNENKVILSVGRLEDTQKGFSFGIKAMNLLKDKYPSLRYVIAGKGPNIEMYENLISKYNLEDEVKLLGYVTDEQKYSLFRRADIFLLPSSKETFGLAIIEAMHFGKPIITTKNEGSIDIIKEGYNGFFAERNENDIANKVEKVLSLNKTKLAVIRKNSIKVSEIFSAENMVGTYKKIIINLVSKLST